MTFVCVCVHTSAGNVHLFISVSTRSWHRSTALRHQGGAASVQMCVYVCDVLGGVWATAVSHFCSMQITVPAGMCLLFKMSLTSVALAVSPSCFSPQPPQPKTPEVPWSETDSPVFHLTDESFDSFLEEHPAALIMFYAPCK